MLEVGEPDLVELTQSLLSELRTLAVTHCLQGLLVQGVSHQIQWLWLWKPPYFFNKVFSEHSLFLRLLEELDLGLVVEFIDLVVDPSAFS